jgi:uncharacterized alpha-E superfamily protein
MLSRVADSLYWMSRYLERAEHTSRLLDVHLTQLVEHLPGLAENQRWQRQLACLNIPPHTFDVIDGPALTHTLSFDPAYGMSVISSVAVARENARQVREQISSEMWMQLNQLYLDITRKAMTPVWSAQPYRFFSAVKEGSHLFQGITDATMNHNEGWHFIQIGRFIERAISIANLLDGYFTYSLDTRAEDYFEWLALLKSATAFEAYSKIYHADLRSDRIAEFLLFNPEFPHSARFCVEMILASLNAISDATTLHKNSRVHRLAGRLRSALSFDDISDVLAGDVHDYLADVRHQATQIHDTLYDTFISYSIDAALA